MNSNRRRWYILIVLIVLIISSFLIYILFRESSRRVDIDTGMKKIFEEEGSYVLKGNKSRCYWVNPVANGTHYLVEISSHPFIKNENGGCQGKIIKSKKIVTDKPANLQGSGCFCGDRCQVQIKKKEKEIKINMEGCKSV